MSWFRRRLFCESSWSRPFVSWYVVSLVSTLIIHTIAGRSRQFYTLSGNTLRRPLVRVNNLAAIAALPTAADRVPRTLAVGVRHHEMTTTAGPTTKTAISGGRGGAEFLERRRPVVRAHYRLAAAASSSRVAAACRFFGAFAASAVSVIRRIPCIAAATSERTAASR